MIEFEITIVSNETGFRPKESVFATVDLLCEICQPSASGLLLYRSTVLAYDPGWKGVVPLPLTSTSRRDLGWPRFVTFPGSQEDVNVIFNPWPLLLYRVLSDLDVDQGNVLRLVKSGSSVRASYE